MSSINFDNVYLLFLLIPLLLLVAVPFALAVRKDNVNGHNIASVTLHTLMAVFVAFAAAGTQINAVMTETDVYVVADVSYSAEKISIGSMNSFPKSKRRGIRSWGSSASEKIIRF